MTPLHDSLEVLCRLASCPDDGGVLVPDGAEALRCVACARKFLARPHNVIDILPRQPIRAGAGSYWAQYCTMFALPIGQAPAGLPWGAPECLSSKAAARKQMHVSAVRSLLLNSTAGAPAVLCDLTGGSGHYTLALATEFDHVFHCDLDSASLLYTAGKAKALGLRNMTFLRVDYLRPPFQHSIGHLVCVDTLIRGPEHELLLLNAIRRALSPAGVAVIDFHNWWHNPLRRLGLLKDNFRDCKSYSIFEATRMLRSAGFSNYDYAPFRQEAAGTRAPSALLRVIPPTRMIFRLTN